MLEVRGIGAPFGFAIDTYEGSEMTDQPINIGRIRKLASDMLEMLDRSGAPIEECAMAVHALHGLFLSMNPEPQRREIAETIDLTVRELEHGRPMEKHRMVGS